MTSVAIMQPTYMPWVGYFALMDSVDNFVLLDSVQFERRSWQQRNRIKTAAGELMLTVPVYKKGLRDQIIADVEINCDGNPLEKHARTIAAAYASAPFMASLGGDLLGILRSGPAKLIELNLAVISWACDALGVSTPRLRSSELAARGRKADLLAEICAEVGATTYISPPGSRGYLEGSVAMAQRNVAVEYFIYDCVPYRQLHGHFVPYLSVVDLILNHGPESARIMRAGATPKQHERGMRYVS
jgi:hypothetical protein